MSSLREQRVLLLYSSSKKWKQGLIQLFGSLKYLRLISPSSVLVAVIELQRERGEGSVPVDCWSARLENVSGVHGAAQSGKS